ncbi:AraC family transcriptional regulator [Fontivita pretiosa]|uniref:helix-turn-helix transcriptional regulator n=1 Tax=Fontivita pretiosa TaxID=2989684 RepID=UPI003D162B4D
MPKIDLAQVPFSAQIAEASRFHLRAQRQAGHPQLRVICGGVERCAADYQIRRNTFAYYGLEFVAAGRGSLVLARRRCRLVPGTAFSYGPGVAHHIRTDADEPLVKYFVDFAGSAARRMLRLAGLSPGGAVQTAAPAEVVPIFDELIRNGMRNSARSGAICAALLQALLLKLAETRLPLGSVETAAFETYQRCRRELEAHALELRSLQQLAQRCGLDQAYLCRLFRRFDHQSPYQRLMRLKMSHAAARMQTPGTLVKQVAAELGFTDPCHFSRAFKSVFGLSPAHLLRQQRITARATARHQPPDTT